MEHCLACCVALGLGAGCKPESDPLALERAEFGVVFGGDIQDREVIALELDPRRQELGLRVTFREPLPRAVRVSWELEKPTRQRAADGGMLYAAELGERRAQSGERRMEARLAFRSSDGPGTWRVRVRVDGRVVHERTFEVVDPRVKDAG